MDKISVETVTNNLFKKSFFFSLLVRNIVYGASFNYQKLDYNVTYSYLLGLAPKPAATIHITKSNIFLSKA